MTAQFRVFKASAWTTWDSMAEGVAEFLTSVGKGNVIGLTQSEDNGTAVIIVWYWD